jgi:hypothetical protein
MVLTALLIAGIESMMMFCWHARDGKVLMTLSGLSSEIVSGRMHVTAVQLLAFGDALESSLRIVIEALDFTACSNSFNGLIVEVWW